MDGLFLIDKDEGITSYDVIKLVKKYVGSSRVGHCGTLDPFATGLLIIGFNQATKVMSFLEHDYKEYEAIISLGNDTDSYDLTGNVTDSKDIVSFNKEQLDEVINSFKGNIKQTPPIYSSIHIDGKHLYEYARNNIEVDIPSRDVTIYDLKVLDFNDKNIKIYVKCSRGTYIRSLGVDIAHKLNNCGHLSYLRRLSIGGISVNDACKVSDLKNNNAKYKKIEEVIDFTHFICNDKQLIRVYNGQSLKINDLNCDKILLMDNDIPCAIYEKHEDGFYYSLRGLYNEEIRFKRLDELKAK